MTTPRRHVPAAVALLAACLAPADASADTIDRPTPGAALARDTLTVQGTITRQSGFRGHVYTASTSGWARIHLELSYAKGAVTYRPYLRVLGHARAGEAWSSNGRLLGPAGATCTTDGRCRGPATLIVRIDPGDVFTLVATTALNADASLPRSDATAYALSVTEVAP